MRGTVKNVVSAQMIRNGFKTTNEMKITRNFNQILERNTMQPHLTKD